METAVNYKEGGFLFFVKLCPNKWVKTSYPAFKQVLLAGEGLIL